MPRLVALFSGCGSMDKRFKEAGYNIVFANDFDKDAFENGCQELEKGALIHFNIACIGNTRANMVQEEYEANLRTKYGDLLEVIIWESGYAINRHFKLKVDN